MIKIIEQLKNKVKDGAKVRQIRRAQAIQALNRQKIHTLNLFRIDLEKTSFDSFRSRQNISRF